MILASVIAELLQLLGRLLTVSYWLELSSFSRARACICTLKHLHLDHLCL